jgi:glycosyltransferase involved in cell wall biosynthesis
VALLYRELLREERPDLVHVHNLAGLSLEIVEHSRRLGIPVVMTLHDYWAICFKNTMVRNDGTLCTRGGPECRGCRSHVGSDLLLPIEVRNRALLDALAGVSRLISPSRYLAARFHANGLAGRRIEVLSYGVELGRFRPRPSPGRGPCTFGYLGYLGRHKGVDVLLEAIANVPEARLVLRGPCDERPRYRARLRELGLEDRVRLEGPLPNRAVPGALAGIDALVLPSLWPDNHPVSILEAMAAGLPVLASRVGGIPELVRHGETGWLVRPGDRAELEARLRQLAGDPGLRLGLGRLARAVAETRYPEARTLDALEAIYADAIAFPLPSAAGAAERAGDGLAEALAG